MELIQLTRSSATVTHQPHLAVFSSNSRQTRDINLDGDWDYVTSGWMKPTSRQFYAFLSQNVQTHHHWLRDTSHTSGKFQSSNVSWLGIILLSPHTTRSWLFWKYSGVAFCNYTGPDCCLTALIGTRMSTEFLQGDHHMQHVMQLLMPLCW